MPYSQGEIRPELNVNPANGDVLNVLVLLGAEIDIPTFSNNLGSLSDYIEDRFNNQYRINIIYQSSEEIEKLKEVYEYDTVALENIETEIIEKIVKELDVDVLYSGSEKLLSELMNRYLPASTVDSEDELKLEIESFMTGKNIAWSFDNPVWNITWMFKFSSSNALTSKYMEYLNKAQGFLSYDSKQIGYVRALVNKTGQVRFAEEQLLAYIQQKNRSERNGMTKDTYNYDVFYDYSFELSFHLGNYYFLMSGCLDIIGRLFNEVYAIGLGWKDTNIEHAKFQDAIRPKNEKTYNAVTAEGTSEWVTWLKRRRNHIAHASSPNYSNILQEKSVKLTDTEIDNRIKAMPAVMRLLSAIPGAAGKSIYEQAKFFVRLHEDYGVWTRDGMEIVAYDSVKKKDIKTLFHPLIDVKYDYDKFAKLLTDIVDAV